MFLPVGVLQSSRVLAPPRDSIGALRHPLWAGCFERLSSRTPQMFEVRPQGRVVAAPVMGGYASRRAAVSKGPGALNADALPTERISRLVAWAECVKGLATSMCSVIEREVTANPAATSIWLFFC